MHPKHTINIQSANAATIDLPDWPLSSSIPRGSKLFCTAQLYNRELFADHKAVSRD